MHSPWLSWFYQYGIGGLVFATGIVLALRTGAVRWSLWTDRRLVLVLIAGILTAASLHAAWIVLATR
ncbi:MAG: hypothetical protein ACR2NM_01715 [Bythopirellula sp.]